MAEEKSKREEELNKLFYLQSIYNQQYEAIMNELTTFGLAQAALKRNINLLENKDKVKGSNVLINAEGGTYIEANVKEMSKVITYVGAGYMVEKKVEQAKEFLNKSLETSEVQIKKLLAEKQKLEDELIGIQYMIEKIRQD